MERLRTGLVIATPESGLSELEKYIPDRSADVFLFPEGHINSNLLEETKRLVSNSKKWLITTVEDYREGGRVYQTGIVINPQGEIVLEHKKTSITRSEEEQGLARGDSLKIVETPIGKIAICVCYELHLPEVARVYALNGAEIIFNPIGTGMWHEHQFQIWTALAQARSYENGVFIVGCSHYNEAIPIAFVYAPNGECLLQERSRSGLISITLDPSKYTFGRNFSQRRPEPYNDLIK